MYLSKYLSHWFSVVFLIWYAAYILKISTITQNFNPYFIAFASFFGYLGLEGYMVFYKEYSLQPSFLMMKVVVHLFPLAILWYIGYRSTKNALRSLLLIVILYIAYITQYYENVTDPYLKDPYPRNWSELDALCENTSYPICRVIRMFK